MFSFESLAAVVRRRRVHRCRRLRRRRYQRYRRRQRRYIIRSRRILSLSSAL